MKKMLHIGAIVALCTSISSCGLLCVGGTATCGLSDEATYRLLHPKTYAQYWEKPGVTKEEWQRDWVTCGGYTDGSFSPTIKQLQNLMDQGLTREKAREKLEHDLKSCMQQKGYQFGNAKSY